MVSARKTTDLPLHVGKAPGWLIERMKPLSKNMFEILIDDIGVEEIIRRLSDPLWFQCLACTLGYDWHSSGTTTVVCGILKTVIDPEKFGFAVTGGKGKVSRETEKELEIVANKFGLSEKKLNSLRYASEMATKVDNATIQDGYRLYHHSMIVSERGNWAVIQQGMNPNVGYARRYQWLSDVKSYVEEPHTGIMAERAHENVLNMTAKASETPRATSTDLAKGHPNKLRKLYGSVRKITKGQKNLFDQVYVHTKIPLRMNWEALEEAYELQPENYEGLLKIKGMGPATVRGLALISELIYGEKASWEDPAKFSFAFGGKDGVPFPVNVRSMDESIDFLKSLH